MKFFSGFCLENEQGLFSSFIDDCGEYNVVGFSYGAILALEYCLDATTRIDRLILLSPAFFADKSEKYKTFQLKNFSKDADAYKKVFLLNTQKPQTQAAVKDLSPYSSNASLATQRAQLQKLLFFQWNRNDFHSLKQKGISIEIYLGENDHILNAAEARDFFAPCADVYFLNHSNHLLA